MVAKSIIETIREYALAVSNRYSVKRIFLFGSYARGTQRPDSDIDIAVVLKNEPEDVIQAEADLYRLGMDFDVRIEPVIVDEEYDPSGFYASISRYGTIVYSAPANLAL
jgi:predicted nucleotidyltransferase